MSTTPDFLKDVHIDASAQDVIDDALVSQPFPEPVALETAARIARLALHMSQHATRNSVIVSPRGLRRWEEMSPEERQRSRVTVIRVIQAMEMLGMIEF
jgi:alkyl hydroperoxide reductase subunit AhpC